MMHQAVDVGFKMVVTIIGVTAGGVDVADRFPALGGCCDDVFRSDEGEGLDVTSGLEGLGEGHGLIPFGGLENCIIDPDRGRPAGRFITLRIVCTSFRCRGCGAMRPR